MTKRHASWDKYEATILLEGLLASTDGKCTQDDAINAVSNCLRAMALKQGMQIDKTYCDKSSINFNMDRMMSAYFGFRPYKPVADKLFKDTVNLYRKSPNEYQKLLQQAFARIGEIKNNDDAFISYLAERVSPSAQILNIDFNANFDVTFTKPIRFTYFGQDKKIDNTWNSLYVQVITTLIKDYPQVFHPNMSFSRHPTHIELANRDNYSFMFTPKPIAGTSYMLETKLSANNIVSKIRYVLNLCNIDYQNIVITYRKNSKSTSAPDQTPTDKQQSKKNQEGFIPKTPDPRNDQVSAVRSCLQAFGRPASYEEIFVALPNLPQDKIKATLNNNAEFVFNGPSKYFHESIVHLSAEELDDIAKIIQSSIDDQGFISGNDLYEAISTQYPYIIEKNSTLSFYGLRDALKIKLGNRFSFKGNIISPLDYKLSMAEVFADYARDHATFTLTNLRNLAQKHRSNIYFEAVYENSLRINQEQFVAKDAVQFPVATVDATLDRLCTGQYLPLPAVANFDAFPSVGYPWNSFLLEHYVACYSEKYMLLHHHFHRSECVGAIVKRSSGFNSFDDLIVDLLANNQVELKKDPALKFLTNNGYIANLKYSGIEKIISKANELRQKNGTA